MNPSHLVPSPEEYPLREGNRKGIPWTSRFKNKRGGGSVKVAFKKKVRRLHLHHVSKAGSNVDVPFQKDGIIVNGVYIDHNSIKRAAQSSLKL